MNCLPVLWKGFLFIHERKLAVSYTHLTEVTTTTDPKKLYRVQVGAYSVKANADAMLKKVQAAGFKDAFIKYS